MNEDDYLAIIFSNTKETKKRNTDLLTIAEAMAHLKELYGSTFKVAEKVGLSPQMVREFLSVFDLPRTIRDEVKSRKIDSVDKIKRIRSIYSSIDEEPDDRSIDIISSMNTSDFRDVERLVKHNRVKLSDALDIIIKGKRKSEHLIILNLTDDEFKIMKRNAAQHGLSEADYARNIIRESILKEGKSR